ncbi:hypothetical protein V9T40_010704 [Parthenolecanium corni]|uniref:J domain-containing protein n=1 Tax=Parthenolecanium corni TaxID=536013 RepID=A0AAN9T7X1_9HEMI
MNPLRAAISGSNQKVPIFALKRCFHLGAALWDKQANQPNFYDILQIPQNATHTEIRDAYYNLSKLYHPDVKKDENSLAMFRKITEAYDVLGSVRTRLEYDNKSLGKYQPYDTSKQEFYASLYRDQCMDGIRRPEVSKVLENKSVIDRFLASEYKDRVAEYRIYKNNLYEHYRIQECLGGQFGMNRVMFCGIISALYCAFKCYQILDDPFSVW